jgi:predicted dehydrogenase
MSGLVGPVGVAVVGAGVISTQYLTNLTTFPDIAVHAIADIDTARAAEAAKTYGVAHSGDVASALALPEVEVVLNLTIPAAHVEVDLAALGAGKHVYSEKPLALDQQSAAKVQAAASAAGLTVGCAPDTFLGAGVQSALRALRSGAIGEPVAAVATFETSGPEIWHPSPEFLFQPGAGPLFDMGPYYLTALVALLGPVRRVAATARTGRAERVIGSGPKAGTAFAVNAPTHVNALLEFTEGASAATAFSFDSSGFAFRLEVIGTEGSLALPDPNTFGGPLRIRRPGDKEWTELPISGTSVGRGIGLLDLARGLRSGTPPRASGELAQHVVTVMERVLDSARDGAFQTLPTADLAVQPLPEDWDPAAATL